MTATIAGAILALGIVGCSTGEPDATVTAPLSSHSADVPWTSDGGAGGPIVIPVCFVTDAPGGQCLKQDDPNTTTPPIGNIDIAAVERAIDQTWGRVSRFSFQFTGKCDRQNDTSPKVVIWIYRAGGDGEPFEGAPGSYGPDVALLAPASVTCPENASLYMRGTGSPAIGNHRDNVAVHDFGHLLGWYHEHSRPDLTPSMDPQLGAGCSPDGPQYGTPNVFHTEYDPNSVMNYCRAARVGGGGDGRLSELDIAGTQARYGGTNRNDSDFDGWDDVVDNCPYVANGDQADSNFDAERQVEVAANATPPPGGEEGRRPLPSDPQAYKDRWHAKYKGDACDPIASTRGAPSIFWAQSKWRTGACVHITLGSASNKWTETNPAQPCKLRMSTGMELQSQFGGPAGYSSSWTGSSQPSFCRCSDALSANPALRATCQTLSHCEFGRDDLFPTGLFGSGSYHLLLHETGNAQPVEATWSVTDLTFVNPMPGFVPSVHHDNWAFIADLAPVYGFPAFPVGNDLTGIFWTKVAGYTTRLYPEPAVANLRNAYEPMRASWGYGTKLAWLGSFQRKWIRVPYCDPTPRPHVWGAVPHMVVAPLPEGDVVAIGMDDVETSDLTARFSASGRSMLALASAREVLVADDRVSGQPEDAQGPNALVVDTGTTRIVGAFTRGEGEIDGLQPGTPVGTQSTPLLRAYAAREGKLYSLEDDSNVVARDVTAALAGQSSVATIKMDAELFSPRAMAYSRANRLLYVIDTPGSAVAGWTVRLSTVNPETGAVVELGQSRTVYELPARITISTTVDGEILLGASNVPGWSADYHAVLLDPDGRPRGSLSGAGSLHAPVVGHAGGITIPLDQAVTEAQPNARLVSALRTALTPSVCASDWLRAALAPESGSTGAFARALRCE